jgi:repressor LexA
MENMQPLSLTRRQQDLLDYLRRRQANGAMPPTLNEICSDLGLKSRGSLHKHITALQTAGLVQPMNRQQRGVRLTAAAMETDGGGDADHHLPLLGRIAAGRPIEAIEDPRPVEVPRSLRTQGSCYVLEVQGDSMIEDGINDGDLVVIEQRSHARNGEIVVALLDGSEVTLKRIEQSPGRITLHPANSNMRPKSYIPERVAIQGVLVGLMRRY